jgi:hypothetical protein
VFDASATSGCCPTDINGDGSSGSQDYFDFLNLYFANDPRADYNADGMINSQDFFDFATAWGNGCP